MDSLSLFSEHATDEAREYGIDSSFLSPMEVSPFIFENERKRHCYSVLVRMRLQRKYNAVTRISSWLRSCWYKFLFERVLAARKLQSIVSRFVNRMKFLQVVKAATLIQRVANVCISRKAGYAKSQIHQLKREQLREKKRKIEGSFEIEEMIQRNVDISPPVNAASEESVRSLIARIKELTKANGGLGTIYDHIAVSETFKTITDLKERIVQTEFQRERLRGKLRKKRTCFKCAAIV